MKRIICLILIMLITFSSDVTAMPITPQHITLDQVSEMVDSVAKIRCYKRDGSFSQGSGFVIDGNILITNYHVAGDSDQIEITINGEKVAKTTADIVFQNEDTDIMGIKLDGATPLKYTTKLPMIGEKVYTMGFPQNKFRMTEGEVKFIVNKYNMQMIISNTKSDSGLSGGILFNDQGEVVGITSRTLGANIFVEVIPMQYVQQEIDAIKEG